jgi:hypothetical protein
MVTLSRIRLAKTPCFSFMFYVFSSTKSENKRAEQVLPGLGERGRVGG